MIRFRTLVTAVATSLLPLSVTQVTLAQSDDESEDGGDEGTEDEESEDEGEGLNDQDKALNFNASASSDDDDDDDEGDAEESRAPASPYEKAGQTYYYVGARYRGLILPQPMLNLMGDGGRTFYHNAFGPELGVRKDDFEMVFAGWFANYKTKPFAFKGSSDPEDSWEVVTSRLKALYLTADFLWTSKLSSDWALVYGFGAGLGVVWGDLFRVQAYPADGGYARCDSPADPDGNQSAGNGMIRDYCDEDNDHYGHYSEPSWIDGGSVPVVLPWLAGQGGIRYRPHEKLALRLDLGMGLTGAFWGIAAGYQL